MRCSCSACSASAGFMGPWALGQCQSRRFGAQRACALPGTGTVVTSVQALQRHGCGMRAQGDHAPCSSAGRRVGGRGHRPQGGHALPLRWVTARRWSWAAFPAQPLRTQHGQLFDAIGVFFQTRPQQVLHGAAAQNWWGLVGLGLCEGQTSGGVFWDSGLPEVLHPCAALAVGSRLASQPLGARREARWPAD